MSLDPLLGVASDLRIAVRPASQPYILCGDILQRNRHHLEQPCRRRVGRLEFDVAHGSDAIGPKAQIKGRLSAACNLAR
jgi:hypothetical protein